jgi:Ca-activated chloride channel family protein
MIRKTFLTLAVVFFAVLTLVIMPVNAGEVSTQGTEQQSNQYSQTTQGFNQSDAVQYAQISWPFQKDQNQGEQVQQQSQESQNSNQSQNQGEQTQQYAQKQEPQNSNQGNQSQKEQSEQQQPSPNQNDSQNNQVNQESQQSQQVS